MNVIYIIFIPPVLNLFVLFLFNNLIGRSSYIRFYSIKHPMENKMFVNQMYSKRRDRTDNVIDSCCYSVARDWIYLLKWGSNLDFKHKVILENR